MISHLKIICCNLPVAQIAREMNSGWSNFTSWQNHEHYDVVICIFLLIWPPSHREGGWDSSLKLDLLFYICLTVWRCVTVTFWMYKHFTKSGKVIIYICWWNSRPNNVVCCNLKIWVKNEYPLLENSACITMSIIWCHTGEFIGQSFNICLWSWQKN